MKIAIQLEKNEAKLQELLKNCDDILQRPMKLGKRLGVDCFLIYIETAVSNMMLADSVIGKMLNRLRETEESAIYQELKNNSLGVSDTRIWRPWRKPWRLCWRETRCCLWTGMIRP